MKDYHIYFYMYSIIFIYQMYIKSEEELIRNNKKKKYILLFLTLNKPMKLLLMSLL